MLAFCECKKLVAGLYIPSFPFCTVVVLMGTVHYGGLIAFTVVLVLSIWFNFKFGDSNVGAGSIEDENLAPFLSGVELT